MRPAAEIPARIFSRAVAICSWEIQNAGATSPALWRPAHQTHLLHFLPEPVDRGGRRQGRGRHPHHSPAQELQRVPRVPGRRDPALPGPRHRASDMAQAGGSRPHPEEQHGGCADWWRSRFLLARNRPYPATARARFPWPAPMGGHRHARASQTLPSAFTRPMPQL